MWGMQGGGPAGVSVLGEEECLIMGHSGITIRCELVKESLDRDTKCTVEKVRAIFDLSMTFISLREINQFVYKGKI